MFASLAQSLIINGKIVTTRAKAKAVQGSVEKMVTLAKSGSIASRRKVMSNLDNKRETTDILFTSRKEMGSVMHTWKLFLISKAM